MTWFKVDDKLHGHPKWRRASPDAKALWCTAGAWSASYRTDGVVLEADLPGIAADTGLTIARARKAARELVEPCELWRRLPDGRPGWQFHRWAEFNPTRSQLEVDDAVVRERKAVHRDDVLKAAVRLRDGDRCRYCDVVVNFADRRSPTAGQYDHVVPLTTGGKTTVGNVVVSCKYHNGYKAGRSLEDAGLTLLTPYETRVVAIADLARTTEDLIPTQSDLARVSGRDGSGRDGSGQVGSTVDRDRSPGRSRVSWDRAREGAGHG